MMITRNEVRHLIRSKLAQAKFMNYIPAVMGRDDGGASFTFTVPGGRGYTYVRIIQSGSPITLTKALNRAGIAETGDLPVWLDQDADGRLVIISARFTG
jgi:hypothetical protein